MPRSSDLGQIAARVCLDADRVLAMAEAAYSAAESSPTLAQRRAFEHVGMKASDLLAALSVLAREHG